MERSYTSIAEPDLFRWFMVGDVSLADIQQLFADQMAFSRGHPGFYVVVDLQRMKQIDAEARRAAARAPQVDGKPMPILAIAVVGGSFHLRLLGKMINKAASVLNRIPETPIEFFGTYDQARQWIATLRRSKASS